jgi:hypothetical protein
VPGADGYTQSTTAHRLIVGTAGVELFLAHPLTGVGWQHSDIRRSSALETSGIASGRSFAATTTRGSSRMFKLRACTTLGSRYSRKQASSVEPRSCSRLLP